MSQVVVVAYNPDWPKQFEALCESIRGALCELAARIEHVGSTAVPGLAAKPVIDIDVVVSSGDVVLAIERLTAIGYRHVGDLGIPNREVLKHRDAPVPHHLYVCPTHSEALANHLAVRDYLRCNTRAAHAYGELKRGLAARYSQDMDGYVEAKSQFLLEILRESGFDRAALKGIEQMNRRRPP